MMAAMVPDVSDFSEQLGMKWGIETSEGKNFNCPFHMILLLPQELDMREV